MPMNTLSEIKSTANSSMKFLVVEHILNNLALGLLFSLSLFSPILYTWIGLKVTVGIQIGLGLVSTVIFIIFLYLGVICYQSIKEDKWIFKIMGIIQPIYLSLGAANMLLYMVFRDHEINFFDPQNIIKFSFLLVMGIIAYTSRHIFNFRKEKN